MPPRPAEQLRNRDPSPRPVRESDSPTSHSGSTSNGLPRRRLTIICERGPARHPLNPAPIPGRVAHMVAGLSELRSSQAAHDAQPGLSACELPMERLSKASVLWMGHFGWPRLHHLENSLVIDTNTCSQTG